MRDLDYITMVLPEKFDIREFSTNAYEFKPKSRKRDVRIRQKRQFEAMKKAGALTPYFRQQNVCVQQACFSKQQATDYIIRTAGDLLLREGHSGVSISDWICGFRPARRSGVATTSISRAWSGTVSTL